VSLQKMLPVVAGDELAAPTLAVELGASVAVHDRVPELTMGLRVRHDGTTIRAGTTSGLELMSWISA
jgi:hypothetical protein